MTSSRDRDRTLVVGRVGAVSGIMRELVGHGLVLMLVYCIYFLYTVYKKISYACSFNILSCFFASSDLSFLSFFYVRMRDPIVCLCGPAVCGPFVWTVWCEV